MAFNIGNYIKELRAKTGLTQVDLARELSVSQATISEMERGERNRADFRTFIRIYRLAKRHRMAKPLDKVMSQEIS